MLSVARGEAPIRHLQVAEQLLRDFVFIHLDRASDKFNLLLAVSPATHFLGVNVTLDMNHTL